MKQINVILMVMVLLALMVMPVMGQVATSTPKAAEAVPVQSSSPQAEIEVYVALGQSLAGIFAAFAVGAVTGIAGLSVFVQRLRNDEVTKSAVEHLAMSLPPETIKQIREIIYLMRDGVNLADEVTDGVKPIPPSPL